jgi:hypothetical protein
MSKLRDLILGAQDLRTKAVDMTKYHGWPETVYIREMSAGERESFARSCQSDAKSVTEKFCALILCDESGARVFADDEWTALTVKSGKALAHIMQEGQRLNGIGEPEIEAIEGN